MPASYVSIVCGREGRSGVEIVPRYNVELHSTHWDKRIDSVLARKDLGLACQAGENDVDFVNQICKDAPAEDILVEKLIETAAVSTTVPEDVCRPITPYQLEGWLAEVLGSKKSDAVARLLSTEQRETDADLEAK